MPVALRSRIAWAMPVALYFSLHIRLFASLGLIHRYMFANSSFFFYEMLEYNSCRNLEPLFFHFYFRDIFFGRL